MLSTPSLPILSGPLWPRVVVSVMFLSMDQIELFNNLLHLKLFSNVEKKINVKLNEY